MRIDDRWDISKLIEEIKDHKNILDEDVVINTESASFVGKIHQRVGSYVILSSNRLFPSDYSDKYSKKKLMRYHAILIKSITAITFIEMEGDLESNPVTKKRSTGNR